MELTRDFGKIIILVLEKENELENFVNSANNLDKKENLRKIIDNFKGKE